jgi:hypothetical protein
MVDTKASIAIKRDGRQGVYEGVTQSGIRGLFTGNFLAVQLSATEDASKKAAAFNFQFFPSRESYYASLDAFGATG